MVAGWGEADSERALAAANCSASTRCLGGFAGFWTNRIEAGAVVLDCDKTCPEEHPPAPSSPPSPDSHPPLLLLVNPKKSSCEGAGCWLRESLDQAGQFTSPRVSQKITYTLYRDVSGFSGHYSHFSVLFLYFTNVDHTHLGSIMSACDSFSQFPHPRRLLGISLVSLLWTDRFLS